MIKLTFIPYRFRVRDIPGIVERHVYDNSNLDSVKDLSIKLEGGVISISYSHEDSHLSGYEPDKYESTTYTYQIDILTNNFRYF